jgi:hypothetical protein
LPIVGKVFQGFAQFSAGQPTRNYRSFPNVNQRFILTVESVKMGRQVVTAENANTDLQGLSKPGGY